MNNRRFKLPSNRGEVVFSEKVLNHMYRHAQTSVWNKEAGGQLFSPNPASSNVIITVATGPHRQDRRTCSSFLPNIRMATNDRHQQFSNGLHVVGLWHTHPEAYPSPSYRDKVTTQQYLKALKGDMDAFLLIIVGNRGTPFNLTVSIASNGDAASWSQLPEINANNVC